MTVIAPDVESLLVAYLQGHALFTGAHVATSVPQTPPALLVTVTPIAGTSTGAEQWLSGVRFQVSCWATTRTAANLLARQTRAALIEAQNVVSALGVFSASNVTYHRWQPDTSTTTPTPRFILLADLTAHP